MTRPALLRLIGRRHADAEPLAQGSDGQRGRADPARQRPPAAGPMLTAIRTTLTSAGIEDPVQRPAACSNLPVPMGSTISSGEPVRRNEN